MADTVTHPVPQTVNPYVFFARWGLSPDQVRVVLSKRDERADPASAVTLRESFEATSSRRGLPPDPSW
jgi:hypothetical protein